VWYVCGRELTPTFPHLILPPVLRIEKLLLPTLFRVQNRAPLNSVVLPQLPKTTMKLTFPDLLRFHRLRLDISQSRAASLLQTPVRTYQSWELGSNAPNRITQKVAVATLENLKTDFLPAKTKQGRPSNREVIVLQSALI
jgi:hypothetical protein